MVSYDGKMEILWVEERAAFGVSEITAFYVHKEEHMKTLEKKKSLIPFFTRGDVGGLTYAITNNIVNYIIIIFSLQGMGWSDELIFNRVIPGLSIGLMVSGFYYAYMAHKLSRKEGRADVTALPSGVSTPAMFVILFGVVSPLSWSLAPEEAWAAAVAACFIGGFIEFLGGFIGPWIKKSLPRAALLGTIAGIGFIWMATQGVFDVFGDPIVGLPILGVAMLGLFGGYLFPKKVSPSWWPSSAASSTPSAWAAPPWTSPVWASTSPTLSPPSRL